MTEKGKHRYYPLAKLFKADREEFPEGQSFAVKKAVVINADKENEQLRLKVVKAAPEDYILDRQTLAKKGLTASVVRLSLDQSMREDVDRGAVNQYGHWRWNVSALRFAGSVLLPDLEDIQAVGAFIPGERSTGYLHLTRSDGVEELFRPRTAQVR